MLNDVIESPRDPRPVAEAPKELSMLEKSVREMAAANPGWGEDERVEGFIRQTIGICEHYASEMDLNPIDVFQALEKKRNISYPNYYNEANFPKLTDVLVFQDKEAMKVKLRPADGFICPSCERVSSNPYDCNAAATDPETPCEWKSYGFFRTLGKGLRFTILENWLDNPVIDECFMPVAIYEAE
ncbi:hypothetical protein L4174_023990 (plasmid) [Photobacterium sp. CCB-ST2H9]|uniref:hypothetical protein n=1 Tax=Photobacterium sp. CCB-ST2H9 TaxID=2912855 RepID=UPI002005A55F|nr:hypothetical protein [Photobacterium sp. CCB-ST2H9]UTM60448.1 hypothetical protein L4174_023990 [Photobacterium sp. CCB-ST2H9]